MMKYYIKKAIGKTLSKLYVIVCVPSGATEVEKHTVIDATRTAGAKDAFISRRTICSWCRSRFTGNGSNRDIGGGTTDAATIVLGGSVSSRLIRLAGDSMDEGIIHYVHKKINLLIGERTDEQVKIDIGCASVENVAKYESMDVRGRDLLTGLPQTMQVSPVEIAEAIKEVVNSIVIAVRETLEETPPEIFASVIDHGIILTDGGALLKNISDTIADEMQVSVFVANNPLDCVALGIGESIKHMNVYKKKRIR